MIGILNFSSYIIACVVKPYKIGFKRWSLNFIIYFCFCTYLKIKIAHQFVVVVVYMWNYVIFVLESFLCCLKEKCSNFNAIFQYESIDDCRCFSCWILNNHCFTNQFIFFVFSWKFWHLTFYQTKSIHDFRK